MLGHVINHGMSMTPHVESLALYFGAQSFFQQVWFSSIGSLAGSWITGSIQKTAYGIIFALLVVNIYAAFSNGNGFRDVFKALAWAVVCAAIVSQWQSIFGMVSNDAFGLANDIGSGDYFTNVAGATILPTSGGSSIFSYFKLLNPLNDIAVFCNFIAVAVTVISYYFLYYFMIIAFTGWGVVMYGVGPLLVALLPAQSTRSLGKQYLISLGQWALWPYLYALMSLIAAIVNTIPAPKQMTILGGQTLVTSVSQVFIALTLITMTGTIPYIAAKILQGDFSGAMGNAMAQTWGSVKDFAKDMATGIPSGGGGGATAGGGGGGAPGGGLGGPGGAGGPASPAGIGPPPATAGIGPGGSSSGGGAPTLGPPGGSSSGGASGGPPALSGGAPQHLLTSGSSATEAGAAASGGSAAAAATVAETASTAAIILV